VVGLLLTLALLLAAAGSLVFGVLRPKARYVFGNNVLTTEDSNVRLSAQDIDELVFLEYGHIYIALAARSSAKARWLNLAYLLFFLALAAGVVAVGAVAFLAV
jgi:hypothetical protein